MIIPDKLVTALQEAEEIVVLTGAGVSAESGIPTFRDALTGLWAKYDPQELATPSAFQHNPQLVWDWYAWRRELVAQKQPNAGHYALAEMQKRAPHVTLITQNVDGLHQLAGSPNPIELHGSLHAYKCFDQEHPVTTWEPTEERPPRCPRCGSLVRPDIVWFGEALSHTNLEAAIEATKRCHLIFSIGTSSQVYPAALLPEIALDNSAIFVEINPNRTPLTHFADYLFAQPSGKILPMLVEKVWPRSV